MQHRIKLNESDFCVLDKLIIHIFYKLSLILLYLIWIYNSIWYDTLQEQFDGYFRSIPIVSNFSEINTFENFFSNTGSTWWYYEWIFSLFWKLTFLNLTFQESVYPHNNQARYILNNESDMHKVQLNWLSLMFSNSYEAVNRSIEFNIRYEIQRHSSKQAMNFLSWKLLHIKYLLSKA